MVSPLAGLFPHHDLRAPSEDHRHPHRQTNVGQFERTLSVLTGGLLVSAGLKRLTLPGLGVAALGAHLIRRGATGHSVAYHALNVTTTDEDNKLFSHPLHQHIRVNKTMTIRKPVNDVFAFWRKFENLPTFMEHLHSVAVTGDKTSHWIAKGPRDRRIEWDAQITEEKPNELIAWRSLDGAQVPNTGQVRFKAAPADRGTEIHILLHYDPPAGVLGALFARLFGEEPAQQIQEDLRRFKQLIEAGEIPTLKDNPQGSSCP